MSEFQIKLMRDPETLAEIIRIAHPGIPEEWMSSTGKTKFTLIGNLKEPEGRVTPKYDWVCIYMRIKGRLVSLGIENCVHPFWGEGITGEMYEDALKNGLVHFKVWRFVDDRLFKKILPYQKTDLGNYDWDKFFLSRGYAYKSTEEFLSYYYSD